MAVGAVNQGTATTFAASTSSAVPYPATTHKGACLVLLINMQGAASSVTTPGGWTLDGTQGGTGGTLVPTLFVFHKTAGADGTEGGGTLSVTHSSGVANRAQILEYEGVDQVNYVDVAAVLTDDSTSGSTTVLNTLTTVTAGCTLVYGAATNTAAQTETSVDNGFTELSDGTGASATLAVAHQQNMPLGALGTTTITWSGAGKQVAVMLALRPAPDLIPPRVPLQPAPTVAVPFQLRPAPVAFAAAVDSDPTLGGLPRWQAQSAYAFTVDRRETVPQRDLRSNPSLLTTAELENELLGGADVQRRRVHNPAAYMDRREVPFQPPRRDPLLLTTAELENELLGSAQTWENYNSPATNRPRTWDPRQPLRLADPSLIATALLEPPLVRDVGHGAFWTDRREVPFQPKRDGTTPGLLDSALLEITPQPEPMVAATHQRLPWWRQFPTRVDQSTSNVVPFDPTQAGLPLWLTAGVYALVVDRRQAGQQRIRISDPSLLLTALLENELLGSADTARHWLPAAYLDRRETAYQPLRLFDQSTPSGLFDGTLGGLAARYVVWPADRRLVPSQRTYLGPPTTALLEIPPAQRTTAATHLRVTWYRPPRRFDGSIAVVVVTSMPGFGTVSDSSGGSSGTDLVLGTGLSLDASGGSAGTDQSTGSGTVSDQRTGSGGMS